VHLFYLGFDILKLLVYTGLSEVHRFHDDRLDMPLMDENDYCWRNRITIPDIHPMQVRRIISGLLFMVHILMQWSKMCHDDCQLDNIYRINTEDVTWCRSCSMWQHVQCCVGSDLEEDMLEDFDQKYLLGVEGIEDEEFLLLIKSPIHRFSLQRSNPLTLEMLQAEAHLWIHQEPFVLNANWHEEMAKAVNKQWDGDHVRTALRKFRAKVLMCRWFICGRCLVKYI
jgi:hypothetical protein